MCCVAVLLRLNLDRDTLLVLVLVLVLVLSVRNWYSCGIHNIFFLHFNPFKPCFRSKFETDVSLVEILN
jgi:hypothetical protein